MDEFDGLMSGWRLPEDEYKHFQARLTQLADRELPGQVGKIYTEAVKACLSVSEYDSNAGTQEKLCWKVCAVLDQCVA